MKWGWVNIDRIKIFRWTAPLNGLNRDVVPFMINNVPPFHRHGTRGSAQSGHIPDVSTEDKAGKIGSTLDP